MEENLAGEENRQKPNEPKIASGTRASREQKTGVNNNENLKQSQH
jgi:hypothetical protein